MKNKLIILIVLSVWAMWFMSVISKTSQISNTSLNKGFEYEIIKIESTLFLPLWVQESVDIYTNKFENYMEATNQKLVYISNGFITVTKLVDGELLWQNNQPIHFGFATNSNFVYGGLRNQHNTLVAYDLETGQKMWQKSFSNMRNIQSLLANDKEIQLQPASVGYRVLDAISGEKIRRANNNWTIFSEADRDYISPLKAIDIKSNQPIWELEIEQSYYQRPLFVDNLIFVKTREYTGTALIVDQNTGNLLWMVPNVISTIGVDKNVVFILTSDLKLNAFDKMTGDLLGVVQFQLNGIKDVNSTDSYQIYVTASDDIVVIYFGDSHQLFAFQFIPPPVTP